MTKPFLLSVVIPAYNEELNIEPVYKMLVKNLSGYTYELVYINDGSTDSTLREIKKVARSAKSKIKLINFSRNFGKEAATTAGIMYSSGDATIMFDADGQFPAELIPKFIDRWLDGAQIVTGVRNSNINEGFVKKYGSKFFYKIINKLSDVKVTQRATDFRLIDKQVREKFSDFKEHDRMTRAIIDWMGFDEAFIEFDANERLAGTASYKTSKLIKLAVNSFVSLSLTPLYISGYAGLIITPLSFILGLFILIEEFILNDPLNLNFTGTAMLAILLLFFVGILLISQGLLALYVSHIHTESKGRPLFIVDSSSSILE